MLHISFSLTCLVLIRLLVPSGLSSWITRQFLFIFLARQISVLVLLFISLPCMMRFVIFKNECDPSPGAFFPMTLTYPASFATNHVD